MKKLLLAVCFLLFAGAAHAQTISAMVVAACNTPPSTYVAGHPYPLTMDVNGNLCGINSGGGSVVQAAPYQFTPLSPGQYGITVATAVNLSTPPTGTTYAVICVSGASVNYTTDGTTTPTASVGMPFLNGSCLALSGPVVIANFKAIQQSATATLNASFFK